MTDLGAPAGVTSYASYAIGINDSGEVVGTVGFGLNSVAFLYTNGTMYNLNTLVTSGLRPSVILGEALGISDNGDIIAQGNDTSKEDLQESFLLVPNTSAAPEPNSWGMPGLGGAVLAAFGVWRCRNRKSGDTV